MKRLKATHNLAMVLIVLLGLLAVGTAMVRAEEHAGASAAVERTAEGLRTEANSGAPYYAIALVMGVSCLSAAYAVGKVGAAALGAAAEKPELLGKAIVFVGLGEGIAIFGLIISLMLINKIP